MATKVGTAPVAQGYGESYTATAPGWGAGVSMENLEVAASVAGKSIYSYATVNGYQTDQVVTTTGTAPATAMSYDFAGRVTQRVAGTTEGFTYDSLDHLTSITRSTGGVELLKYGPTGELLFRRFGTTGTWYIGAVATVTATVPSGCTGWSTADTVKCTATAGTVKVSAHVQVAGGRVATVRAGAGTGIDPITDVLYYHRDMQGSVVATTLRSGGTRGVLGARYRYTPYGQLDLAVGKSAANDSELGFTGGLRLGFEAGQTQQGNLVLLGARVYHAELKRWLVPDTVDARRYTYAGGDPVNLVDPSGRMPISDGNPRRAVAYSVADDIAYGPDITWINAACLSYLKLVPGSSGNTSGQFGVRSTGEGGGSAQAGGTTDLAGLIGSAYNAILNLVLGSGPSIGPVEPHGPTGTDGYAGNGEGAGSYSEPDSFEVQIINTGLRVKRGPSGYDIVSGSNSGIGIFAGFLEGSRLAGAGIGTNGILYVFNPATGRRYMGGKTVQVFGIGKWAGRISRGAFYVGAALSILGAAYGEVSWGKTLVDTAFSAVSFTGIGLPVAAAYFAANIATEGELGESLAWGLGMGRNYPGAGHLLLP